MKNKPRLKSRNGVGINRKIGAAALVILLWSLMLPIIPSAGVQAQSGQKGVSKTDRDRVRLTSKHRRDGKVSSELMGYADRALNNVKTANETMPGVFQRQGSVYLFANVEFKSTGARERIFSNRKESTIKGAAVLTVFEQFADVFISTKEALIGIAKLPGVFKIEPGSLVAAPPPPAVRMSDVPSKAVPDTIVRGGLNGYKGKGVIIAIVDSGVDFRHPDFITYDANGKPTSRLLYLWDTGLEFQKGRGNPAPFNYPNQAPIGTVFSRDQLTSELRSAVPSIPSTDRQGHGTACASVAAGNGNADKGEKGLNRNEVIGVAPDADIIGISLDIYRSGGFSGGYLINAVSEWLDEKAGTTPLVVSNSWGGHTGGHDGQRVEQRQLDARFAPAKQSRAILFAAGNDGDRNFHAVAMINAGSTATISWEFYRGWIDTETKRPLPSSLSLYFDRGSTELRLGPKWIQDEFTYEENPLTGQDEMTLAFDPSVRSLDIENVGKQPIKVDIYMPSRMGEFTPPHRNRESMVGEPGSMRNAITVGSYDWNDNFHRGGSIVTAYLSICSPLNRILPIGEISCYSSPGPTRDGRVKPEFAAPGMWFTSSRATGILPKQMPPDNYIDSTGKYRLMNGTSAATPYTAGIVALMFEKKADLTFGEVRDLLLKNASRDPFTGIPPGTAWGSGKLDMKAVESIFAAIE